MKNKRKQFFFTSLCLSSIAIIGLSISCSKTQNNQEQNPDDNKPPVNPDNNQTDEQAVKEYIKTLNPKIKENKVKDQNKIVASSITSIEQLNQWFDHLPQSDNQIQVKLISLSSDQQDPTILIIKYQIQKNNYSEEYIFKQSGFKTPSSLMNFRQFSERNAFAIRFQISDDFSIGPNASTFYNVSGTAWSWYYQKKSETLYDWYLMTNFHVIDQAVAFTKGYSKIENGQWKYNNPDQLVSYYQSAINTTYDINKNYFELSTYSDNIQSYQSLIHANKQGGSTHLQAITNKDVVKNVDIITDFNNDSLDLFSKSNANKNTLYNLDMALVKISMDFNGYTDRLKKEYQRRDLVTTYQNNVSYYQKQKFDPNKQISISGNPVAENQLITTNIDGPFYFYQNVDFSNAEILKHFRAPYFFTNIAQPNFKLSGGASGSAVYQLNNSSAAIQWDDIMPIGIYWGGYETLVPDAFIPSLIPFIIDYQGIKYDIFENFLSTSWT